MSGDTFEVGGEDERRIFKRGEKVKYRTVKGDTAEYTVDGPSEDGGIILKSTSSNRSFAISEAALERVTGGSAPKMSAKTGTAAPTPAASSPPKNTPDARAPPQVSPGDSSAPVYVYDRPPASSAPASPASTGRGEKFRDRLKHPPGTEWKDKPSRALKEFVMFCAIAVCVIDAFVFNWSLTDKGAIYWRILMYLIMAVLVHAALNREWPIEASVKELLIVSVIPVFLLPIISYGLGHWVSVPQDILDIISGIILAFPVWPFYLRYFRGIKMHAKSAKELLLRLFFTPAGWATIWFVIITVVVLYNLVTLVAVPVSENFVTNNPAITAKAGIQGIGETFRTARDNFVLSFQGLTKSTMKSYQSWKNETLGTYYSGQVEQNKEQTGIFITDFRATGAAYDTLPLTAYALVKARSFGDKTPIDFYCYAQNASDRNGRVIQGTTNPSSVEVYREDQIGVMCEISDPENPKGGLAAGRYNVWFEMNFDFETWAYVEYYFMDEDFYSALIRDQKDPNTYFGVPKATKTIYTAGPVKVGMSDKMSMPFLLSTKNTKTLPVGFTIENVPPAMGGKGEIQSINRIDLIMPEQFREMQCSTGKDNPPAESADTMEGYTKYTFTNQHPDLKDLLYSVTCNTKVGKDDSEVLLRRVDSVNAVTIAGVVYYNYNLSRQITIEVRATPGSNT